MRKSYFQMLRSGIIALALSAMLIIGFSACSNGSSGQQDPGTPATITFTVTFNTNGGSSIASQTVEKGNKATKPTNPTKKGTPSSDYVFNDWFSDSALTTKFDFDSPINADITLYAKWDERPKSFAHITTNFTGTSYTVLESGTNGSGGTSATYVLFGDWPQSLKDEDVFVYEEWSVIQGMFTYYKGYDNAWYAKIDNKYYKVEPIKWRVLDSTKKLLLAENVLAITDCNIGQIEQIRKINGISIHANNYEYGRIRAYLNGFSYEKIGMSADSQETVTDFVNKGFLQTAFTILMQNSIADTNVDNSAASTFADGTTGTNGDACDDTTDKIFLLSRKEVTTSAYGFTTDSIRKHFATDFAKASDEGFNFDEGPAWPWWLRSPAEIDMHSGFYYVKGDGSADEALSTPALCGNGIVPALCLQ